MSRHENRSRKKSKKKTIVKTILIIIGILLVTIGGFAYYVYKSAENTVKEAYEPIEASDKRDDKVDLNKKDPISILLIGVDERKGDRGRSDTLILVTLNPNSNSMNMLSIPRDTRTEIIGKGIEDKINHAYAFGGTEMTVKTIENFLDIPVDYYVKVNMEALSEIVDTLGGITVNNTLDWYDEGFYKKGYHYKKGEISLTGAQTIGYVRMRYQDPRGDFGRNDRQRQVINAIIKKGANPAVVTKMNSLFDVLGNNVKTNMTFDEMKTIQSDYAGARNNSQSLEIKGMGTKINGTYYLDVSEEERKSVSNTLKTHLEISN